MIFFIYHFHNFADKDKDKNQDKEFGAITWSCDLVTQLTFLDKLRNSNHDIGGSVTDSQRVIAFAMFFYFRLCWIETIIRAHISFSDVLFITIPLMWKFPVLSSQLRGRSCNETSFLKLNILLLLLILTSWTLWPIWAKNSSNFFHSRSTILFLVQGYLSSSQWWSSWLST